MSAMKQYLMWLWLIATVLTTGPARAFDNGINDLHGGTPAPPGGSGGPPGPGPGPDGGPGSGDPVAIYTGQYFLNTTDFEIPGRMPLRVRRFYRSGSSYQGMFGRGWNLEFNERILVLATNGNLVLRRNGTARDEFNRTGASTFVSAVGGFETIVRKDDGTYLLSDRFGSLRRYESDGTLVEVADRHGNQLLFKYAEGGKLPINAISDHSHITNAILVARDYRLTRMELAFSNRLTGRFIEFSYDSNGRVTQATDFTGRAWKYSYDDQGFGNLLSVTTPSTEAYPSGLSTRYSYTVTNHCMETVIDKSGNTVVSNRYDALGRVIRQTWGTATWGFAYPNATDRWETNGNGHRILRIFDAAGNMKERREYTAGLRPGEPAFHSLRFEYTAGQQGSKTVYPAGNVFLSRYDDRGNLIETRLKAADGADSPADVVTRMTYEPRFSAIKSSLGPRGDQTTYHYDYEDPASGSARGDLVKVEFPAQNAVPVTLAYSYTPFGQIAWMTNEVGMVTRFVYEEATGYMLQRIEAFGTTSAATNVFTYDVRGNLITVTDPNGNTTTHRYDALDRLVEVTAPAPQRSITRFAYTGNGKPSRVERQTGEVSRPWKRTDYSYDTLDRLVSISDDLGLRLTQGYDGNGNIARVMDAGSNVTSFVHDERNLLWRSTDALSNTMSLFYTPNGMLSRKLDGRSNATSYAYDSYDRVIAVTNADGAVERYVRDLAGNTAARLSRTGRWTTNTLDSLGRLASLRYPDGAQVTYDYDAAGRAIRVVATNGVWSFGYDVLGRRVAATNSHGRITRYLYDRAGNLSQLVYPDGTFLRYAHDTLNRLTNVTYGAARTVASLTYDLLGRRTSLNFGNGTRAAYTYDSGDRITEILHQPAGGGAPLARFNTTFDAVGNPLTQDIVGTESSGRSLFEYDRAHQLTRAQYPAGGRLGSFSVSYDRAGNRSQVNAGSVSGYTVNNRNQYTSVGGQPYTYNANGALTGDGTWTFGHDDEDLLQQAAGPGITARYEYDPFHRRISKNVNGVVRQFVYNETGDLPMLLAETDPSGAAQAKYVIYGLSPLAMIVGDNVFGLHCDLLERPVLATDAGGAVAWRGTFSAFSEGGVAANSTVQQPLRTPGQYSDAETGLNYNMARYYSPKLGRFLTEDPAVEADSPLFAQVQDRNAYAYVRNNPMTGIDPNGQSVFFIVCSAGLPVCSAALFCSLNVGACSGGVICSANIGACSAALACSGNAGAGCSASLVACSANVAAACSGTAGGVCSGAVVCSAQLGSGAAACSGSILACSAQAGWVGASACSGNLAGVCSAQAGLVGASACSAQLVGICSAQVGAGGAACSAQAAGACSGQFGPGVSLCSSQMGGACSLQWGPGYSGCSAQLQGCSADASCKNASLPSRSNEHWALASHPPSEPPSVGGWWAQRAPDGRLEVRLVAKGAQGFKLHAQGQGGEEGRYLLTSGSAAAGGVIEFSGYLPASVESKSLRLTLDSASGKTLEFGPIAVPETAPAKVTSPSPGRSVILALFLNLTALLGCIGLPFRLG